MRDSMRNGDRPLRDFSPDKFILKPAGRTLNSLRFQAELVESVREFLFYALLPDAAQGPNGRVHQRNFLLYGPPGTGKSHFCCAVAGTLSERLPDGRSATFAITDQLSSKYADETERRLRAIFQAADQCEIAAFVIDGIDELCSALDHNSPFLAPISGLLRGECGPAKRMVFACASNPWQIEPALLNQLDCTLFDYPTKSEIIGFWWSRDQWSNCFGETPEERDRLIHIAAGLCAEKRYSYRGLRNVTEALLRRAIAKAREAYPNGSAEPAHMLPLAEAELREILAQIPSDFDSNHYEMYHRFKAFNAH